MKYAVHDKFRCIRDFLTECLSDQRICFRIYRTGRVIQNQDFRFFQKCSCNTDSLFLTAGYIASALLNVSIVFIRKCLDKIVSLGELTDMNQLFICRIFISQRKFSLIVPENSTFF